jgi:DNA-binding HxlR family transcriptional regulator
MTRGEAGAESGNEGASGAARRSGTRAATSAGDFRGDACSIERALGVIGDRWTILIMRDAFRGIRRFSEIHEDLGIPKAVLADRLRELVEAGVLEKRQYLDHPPRFEYRLTPMGRELSPILVSLMHWGDRHLSAGTPPTVLLHSECGTEVELELHCRTCRRNFDPTEITSRHPAKGSPTSREAK